MSDIIEAWSMRRIYKDPYRVHRSIALARSSARTHSSLSHIVLGLYLIMVVTVVSGSYVLVGSTSLRRILRSQSQTLKVKILAKMVPLSILGVISSTPQRYRWASKAWRTWEVQLLEVRPPRRK